MVIEETLKIAAPLPKIWQTILDIPFLLSCVPGIEKVEVVDENTYKAVLKGKVSIMTATFDTVITVVDKQEPVYIKVSGEGKGRMGVGRVTFTQAVSLKSISAQETEVSYKLDFNVIGRLATLGGKAIAKKIDEVAEAFSNAFIAKCQG
jgi:carbon monoxide dehydrogenase subunit G